MSDFLVQSIVSGRFYVNAAGSYMPRILLELAAHQMLHFLNTVCNKAIVLAKNSLILR